MAIKGQEDGRRMEQFTDTFGRLYEANIEISTGDPCEVLRPVGWAAPMGPDWARGMLTPPLDDHEVVRMVPRLYRARKGYQIEIDFVRWLAKWDEAEDAFVKKIADYAHGMTRGTAQVIEWINSPPPELMKLVGNGPRAVPRAFIEAAAAGNEWALGLTDTVPGKAQAILDEIQPLVLRKRRRGILGADPLADDRDDDETTVGQDVEALADPLADALADLEDQFDPKATGGQKVPTGKRRQRAAVDG